MRAYRTHGRDHKGRRTGWPFDLYRGADGRNWIVRGPLGHLISRGAFCVVLRELREGSI